MGLTVITRLLTSVLILQTSQSAVMRLYYGTEHYYVTLHINNTQFKSFTSCMTSGDTEYCELTLRIRTAPFAHDVLDVRKVSGARPHSNNVPKYSCAWYSGTNTAKCENVKIMVTCRDVSVGDDLFGISWNRKPDEYLADPSLSNTTKDCQGEYDSRWAVAYYRSGNNPSSFRSKSTNSSFGQQFVTARVNEDSVTFSSDVETSTMTNVFTTEEVDTSSSASLAVIVVCSVLGVVVILVIALVSYCLVCRRKRTRARDITKQENDFPPRYEEVIIPLDVDAQEAVVKRAPNNNFGGISAIYSYPYPSSVNKRLDEPPRPSTDSSDRTNLADYSRPVDSYHDPNQIKQNGRSASASASSDGPRRSKKAYINVKPSDNSQVSEYSNPDDALDNEDQAFIGQNRTGGDYTELESVRYSTKREPPGSPSASGLHEYADPNTCVPHRMMNGQGQGQGAVREYNKLGEEQRRLLHNYDLLGAERQPAVYSVAKIV